MALREIADTDPAAGDPEENGFVVSADKRGERGRRGSVMAYAISDEDRRLNYFFRGQEGDPEHVFEYAQGLGKWAGLTEEMVLLQRVKEERKPMATLHLCPPDSAAGRGAEEVEYREAIMAAAKEMGLHIHMGANAGELVVVRWTPHHLRPPPTLFALLILPPALLFSWHQGEELGNPSWRPFAGRAASAFCASGATARRAAAAHSGRLQGRRKLSYPCHHAF
jgi:hypothetical protein